MNKMTDRATQLKFMADRFADRTSDALQAARKGDTPTDDVTFTPAETRVMIDQLRDIADEMINAGRAFEYVTQAVARAGDEFMVDGKVV